MVRSSGIRSPSVSTGGFGLIVGQLAIGAGRIPSLGAMPALGNDGTSRPPRLKLAATSSTSPATSCPTSCASASDKDGDPLGAVGRSAEQAPATSDRSTKTPIRRCDIGCLLELALLYRTC